MSPELRKAVETLEKKAKRVVRPQDRVLRALHEAGAHQVVQELIEADRQRKAEALNEAARLRTVIKK